MTATQEMFEKLANQVAEGPHAKIGLIRLANVLLGTKSLAWDGRKITEKRSSRSTRAISTPWGGQIHK